MKKLLANVPVLDTGARGSTITFTERGIGDVLLAWENEAYLAVNELGPDKFEIVTPSQSILAEPSIAVVDKVVDKKGTREVATAYLNYLYSPEGQELAAKNYYRPRNEAVAEKYKDKFAKVELFTIDQEFGGWDKAQKTHFSDGGRSTRSTRNKCGKDRAVSPRQHGGWRLCPRFGPLARRRGRATLRRQVRRDLPVLVVLEDEFEAFHPEGELRRVLFIGIGVGFLVAGSGQFPFFEGVSVFVCVRHSALPGIALGR